MTKGSRGQRRIASHQRRPTPYPLPTCRRDICEDLCPKKCSKALNREDWEDVTCSVCMEYPHNAVLLLCSSHDKGCRPYMCKTSFRHSNCLNQYKKAYTKVTSSNNGQPTVGLISNLSVQPDSNFPLDKGEIAHLACPLCRGQVKGWTVVKPVREYLNAKKRSCMHDSCSFSGNYKELRKHVRAEHPLACPHAVDPAREQKWRWLELEREREDVISTITSAMPGAIVFGDYVIERNHNILDTDEEGGLDADVAESSGRLHVGLEAMNFFLLLNAVRQGNHNLTRHRRRELAPHLVSGQSAASAHHPSPVGGSSFSEEEDGNDEFRESDDDGVSLVSHLQRRARWRDSIGSLRSEAEV